MNTQKSSDPKLQERIQRQEHHDHRVEHIFRRILHFIERVIAAITLIVLIGALAVMPLFNVKWKMVKGALPQGVCWVVSIWGLYVCFGLLGAAFGNVIQASRGVISLILGIILSFFAIQGLEQQQSVVVWLRKTAAALLMFGAIVLYALAAKG